MGQGQGQGQRISLIFSQFIAPSTDPVRLLLILLFNPSSCTANLNLNSLLPVKLRRRRLHRPPLHDGRFDR